MTRHSVIWPKLLTKIIFLIACLLSLRGYSSLWTPFTHKVVKGETLAEVARKTGIREDAIIQQNQLKSPFALKEGQNLLLPKPSILEEREEKERVALEKKQHSSLSPPRRQGPTVTNKILKTEKLSDRKALTDPLDPRLRGDDNKGNGDDKKAIRDDKKRSRDDKKRNGNDKKGSRDDQKKSIHVTPASSLVSPASPVIAASSPVVAPASSLVTPAKAGAQSHKRNLLKQKPSPIKAPTKKLCFLKPIKGPTLAPYGPLKNGTQNDGINIGGKKGSPVKASEHGTVIYRGNDIESYGNLVLIKHNDTWVSTYGHLKDIKIKRGERIKRGQIIGTVGTTGHVKKPQLHFELRRHHRPVDPTAYLEKKSD